MNITDPGPQYEYLNVEISGNVLQVLKRNRTIRFDAFWATEPAMEEDKPDHRMTYSEIPSELWDVLSNEERLGAFLTGAQRELKILKKKVSNLEQYLFLAVMVIVSFVSAFLFSKFG